jgi:hypothetical protein
MVYSLLAVSGLRWLLLITAVSCAAPITENGDVQFATA